MPCDANGSEHFAPIKKMGLEISSSLISSSKPYWPIWHNIDWCQIGVRIASPIFTKKRKRKGINSANRYSATVADPHLFCQRKTNKKSPQ